MINILLNALGETLYMIILSGALSIMIGLPVGVLLHCSRKHGLYDNPYLYRVLNFIVDTLRSIPFIILIVALIPLTRIIVGTSVGTNAAIVPLTIGAAPFVARIIANALSEVSYGLIEAGKSMGASNIQIVWKIMLPEALPNIINGMTLMLINLVGYSAMAGAVGAGGLGEVAIDYGYQRFNTTLMFTTVIILIVLVQAIQLLGDRLVKRATH